jgi:hypothetical protein
MGKGETAEKVVNEIRRRTRRQRGADRGDLEANCP